MRGIRLLPLLAVAACGPAVQSAVYTAPPPPHAPDHDVRIYSATLPRCEFREIGRVSAQRSGPRQSDQRLIAAMRERARAMGGDAIVGLRETSAGDGSTLIVPVGNVAIGSGGSTLRFSGTVVRFVDPECRE
jgi:hypothetical protein